MGALHSIRGLPWALTLEKYREVLAFLEARERGQVTVSEEAAREVNERISQALPVEAARGGSSGLPMVGSVAVISCCGMLSQRMNMLTYFSGGTSTDLLGVQIERALNDPEVSAVVLDIDSPGGSVFGVQEVSNRIFETRNQDKPVHAVINSLGASGAYWLGSQAGKLFMTPGGQAGSIGVYATHVDESAANEQDGVKVTLISAGKFKVEGNPHEPLGSEAAGHMQVQVDYYYDLFLNAVARGRGVRSSKVEKDFGQGRVVNSEDALAAGMIDGIKTLSAVLRSLGAPVSAPGEDEDEVEGSGDLEARGRQYQLEGIA